MQNAQILIQHFLPFDFLLNGFKFDELRLVLDALFDVTHCIVLLECVIQEELSLRFCGLVAKRLQLRLFLLGVIQVRRWFRQLQVPR